MEIDAGGVVRVWVCVCVCEEKEGEAPRECAVASLNHEVRPTKKRGSE